MSFLTIDNVTASYGNIPALHSVSLSVNAGEVVALLGANGAGKTTTLRCISRTVRTSGQITVDGVDVTKLSTHQVARLGVAHVPEGRGTLRELTVQENLLMGAYGRGRREKRTKLAEVLDLLPQLRDRRKQQAGTLSGGEQQILAFGRTLMADPKLLLLDEPSLGLSPKATSDVYRIITDTVRANKLTVLLAEQNVAYASRIADRAYVMQTGYTREVSDLQALPELADTYLS